MMRYHPIGKPTILTKFLFEPCRNGVSEECSVYEMVYNNMKYKFSFLFHSLSLFLFLEVLIFLEIFPTNFVWFLICTVAAINFYALQSHHQYKSYTIFSHNWILLFTLKFQNCTPIQKQRFFSTDMMDILQNC